MKLSRSINADGIGLYGLIRDEVGVRVRRRHPTPVTASGALGSLAGALVSLRRCRVEGSRWGKAAAVVMEAGAVAIRLVRRSHGRWPLHRPRPVLSVAAADQGVRGGAVKRR
jgi:hypothetical protein